MCHALLYDPKFLALLLRIDHDLAARRRADGCACGGSLHRADYPRKPRGCPVEVRDDHSSRLSFCCSVCRRRATSMSVRFLGQRVYLALAVVLVSARPAGPTPAEARLGTALGVERRTLAGLVVRAVPAHAAVAVDQCALPAAGARGAAPGRIDRTFCRPDT